MAYPTPQRAWTPGPWEACDPGAYGDFDGESRVICGDDMRIAVVHWNPREMRAENDANALLIAAAPQLADAAAKLLACFDEIRSLTVVERIITGRSDSELRKASNDAMDELRAALALAQGQVP